MISAGREVIPRFVLLVGPIVAALTWQNRRIVHDWWTNFFQEVAQVPLDKDVGSASFEPVPSNQPVNP